MESSVVILVGMTATLLLLLIKFQVRLIEVDDTVELKAIKQTRSCASPIIPCCKLFGNRKTLGVGAVCMYVHKRISMYYIHSL